MLIRIYNSLFNVVTQYLGPRSRLAFYPTLYKFIVQTLWAWIHSCFGVQAKSGPYNAQRISGLNYPISICLKHGANLFQNLIDFHKAINLNNVSYQKSLDISKGLHPPL